MKRLPLLLILWPTLALAEPMTAAEFEACLNNIPCLTAYNKGQVFHEERQPVNTLEEELDTRMLGLHPFSFSRTPVPFLGLYPLTPLYPLPFDQAPVQHW